MAEAKLQVGDAPPDFELTTDQGVQVRVSPEDSVARAVEAATS